jgi:diaminohydroxyphosphoribosylaminopyrimidine deaminase/5-amino-6-(5-phosphoribosylamino)uracil reductase
MNDKKYMRLALSLARKGRTTPNPKVGCVIVKKGKIIGKGYHKKAGLPHAEVEAIQNSKQETGNLRNATMYLTLEPCCSTYPGKRTPACTEAILNSGITNITIAMRDPNPKVQGKGIRFLKKNGIKVDVGLLEAEAKAINLPYIKWIQKKVPYVALKMAMSLDGKIATNSGDSKWVSGPESRKLVHKMRDQFDAVMVGASTVEKDDPRLTARIKGGHDPIRIIVDSDLCIGPKSSFMKRNNVILATTESATKTRISKFESMGARVIISGKKRVDLKKLMKELGALGIQSVLLEGGSELCGSAVENKIVDKIYFFVASKIIGGRNAKGPIGGAGIEKIKDALKVKNMLVKESGEDLLIEADL